MFFNSELEKVKLHRQKISKWQGQVAERLQALARRTGSNLIYFTPFMQNMHGSEGNSHFMFSFVSLPIILLFPGGSSEIKVLSALTNV